MPWWRAPAAFLLLAALATCNSLPQPAEPEAGEGKGLSVDAPMPAAAAGQSAAEEELPEPQAENPGVAAGLQPSPGSEAVAGGETGPAGVDAPGDPAAAGAPLPEPRPPAESRKTPAAAPAKNAKKPPPPKKAKAAQPGAAARPVPPVATEPKPAEPAPREVLARQGDTVVIDLEGRGWLLLPGERLGISFLGSESGPQRTSFSFKALELGDYELAFQLQDNVRGAATGNRVRLRVLSGERLREMLAAQAAGQAGQAAGPDAGQAASASADPARLQKAEQLFAGGFYDLALPEYLAIYQDADPLLNDRLAAIYLRQGEAAAAAKFYDRNLRAGTPYGGKAIVGLVRAGLALASPELVLQHLPAFLELPAADTEGDLLGVAAFVASQGSHALALELLNEYLRRFPRGGGLDEAYFQLARLYELESPLRDLRLAREYYSRVYEQFPESEHAVEARTRIQYLDRHFFHVQ